jgi:hypothetical protein
MNQSGEKIKIYVSNLTDAELSNAEITDNRNGGQILDPGDLITRDRSVPAPYKTVEESVMVYSLQYNSQTEYLPRPVAGRDPPFSNSNAEVKDIREVARDAIIAVRDALKLQLLPVGPNGDYDWDDDNFFKPLELGGVAHELDTLPSQVLRL